MVLPIINGELNFLRKLITIDGSKVTTETGIPLGLNVNLPGCRADCGDVRLAKLDGTSIAREIECKDVPNSDDVMIWYPFDTVASTDSQFWVYWGNSGLSEPSANSTYGSQNVWGSDYKTVYLFNTEVYGSSLYDSTSRGKDATPVGFSENVLNDATYGKHIYLDGTNYFTKAIDNLGSVWSVTMKFKTKNATDHDTLFDQPTSRTYLVLYGGTTGKYYTDSYDDVGYNFTNDQEYIITLVVSGTTAIFYANGVEYNTMSVSSRNFNQYLLRIGANANNDNKFDGYFNHFCVKNVAASSNYTITTHKNLKNPTAAGTTPFYKSFGLAQHQRITPQFV